MGFYPPTSSAWGSRRVRLETLRHLETWAPVPSGVLLTVEQGGMGCFSPSLCKLFAVWVLGGAWYPFFEPVVCKRRVKRWVRF